uniref:Uncharacterized protein n=1 Tax=Panagrellus redivivus TaxID=6233 RepID=A0A7E4VXZ4_PANRE
MCLQLFEQFFITYSREVKIGRALRYTLCSPIDVDPITQRTFAIWRSCEAGEALGGVLIAVVVLRNHRFAGPCDLDDIREDGSFLRHVLYVTFAVFGGPIAAESLACRDRTLL